MLTVLTVLSQISNNVNALNGILISVRLIRSHVRLANDSD